MAKSIEDMSDEEIMGMANAPPPDPADMNNAEGGSQEDDGNNGENQGSDGTGSEDSGNTTDAGTVEANAGDASGTGSEDDSGDTSKESGSDTDDKESQANPLSDDDDTFGTPKPKAPVAPVKDEPKGESKPTTDDKKPVVKPEEKVEPKVEPAAAVNYEAEYKRIMAPFRANGKEVSLKNPDEVIQLMQLGANYTKKLQALQPNLKVVKMLENNGLLDESKLGFLIDLSKKDPEAIKKLVADSGMDPMDIDPSAESQYKPKNYSVSDNQMLFDQVLEETSSDPMGQEILVQIHKEWDKGSKDTIFKDPKILRTLTNHKKSGFYDQIMAEVEHQKTLNQLNDVPILTAYYQVGDIMNRNGLLKQPAAANPAPTEQQVQTEQPKPAKPVVATRTAPRQAVSDNGDKAKAAAPTRNAPAPVKSQDFNPLSMSDEEFEKNAKLAQRL